MVLRLYVHIDETQSLFLAFDLYITLYNNTFIYLYISNTFIYEIIRYCNSAFSIPNRPSANGNKGKGP